MNCHNVGLTCLAFIISAACAARAEELGAPSQIPDLPNIADALAGRSVDSVTAILGAPQSANVVGSFQFVQFQSINCLSRPHCYVTAPCYLTLTVTTSDSKISSAKIEGTVNGDPYSRGVFLSYVPKLCNADFSRRLSALATK